MTYYNYRTTKSQASLDELQTQRDATIEKLKNATKYNTTQELLKKYSGTPSSQKKSLDAPDRRSTSKQDDPKIMKEGRTGLLPPPTANISANLGPVAASNMQRKTSAGSRKPLGQFHPMGSTVPGQDPSSPQSENAEFAPNAFSSTLEYAQAGGGPRWYDRLMDVLLGEDEQLPRNRIALICKQCRLVNGQAPPGAKRLEDTGKWRCGGCGTMNGEETEIKKIVESIKDEVNTQNEDFAHDDDVQNISEVEMDGQQISFHADEGEESDITQYSEVSSNRDEVSHPNTEIPEPSPLEDNEPIKRKVGRPKGSKKQRK